MPPRRGARTAFGLAGGGTESVTAAATSNRPHPKTGFGTLAPENPPQSCVEVSGTAVRSSTLVVASTCPINCGAADQRSATAPVTCGADPDVPEKPPVKVAGGAATRTPTPGAERSGFNRLDPSAVIEPRLEKVAIVSLRLVAPIENEAS